MFLLKLNVLDQRISKKRFRERFLFLYPTLGDETKTMRLLPASESANFQNFNLHARFSSSEVPLIFLVVEATNVE